MITHKEIIEISKHYNLNINQSSTIERYVKQNQLKEERAKKVEELLELYQLKDELKEHYAVNDSVLIVSLRVISIPPLFNKYSVFIHLIVACDFNYIVF